jgi:nucleoside-diphosphate-sugar epimerase
MVHIILTGSTGLVGSAVLAQLLHSTTITRVSILSRRPIAATEGHKKANVIIQSDYSNYPQSVIDQLKDADACIWAQGKSSMGMTEKDYTELTHDWPLAAARAFGGMRQKDSSSSSSGGSFNFVYVSGEGADQTQKARAMFGRIKGRAEKDLVDLASSVELRDLSVYNLRPAGIDGSGSAAKPDRVVSMPERMAGWLYPAVKLFAPKWHTPVDSLAKVAIDLAVGSGKPLKVEAGVEADGRTLGNVAIRRLAGL